jgi:exopolyphosphatase/guanosine-5'-triphosphate,3'-diphosphate pyrophosphatase
LVLGARIIVRRSGMAKKKYMAAVIHLGSEKVTMQIIQYTHLSDVKIIDESSRTVRLGEETFQTGRISIETTLQIVSILKGFRLLMKDYGVRSYVLEATTAVREARNRQFFIDQILVKTGFRIEVISMPQEIFRKMASLVYHLGIRKLEESLGSSNLMVDLSSGAIGFTYYHDGEIEYQQNLHVGLVRLKEYFTRNEQASMHFEEALNEYMHANLTPVVQELQGKKIDRLILSGAESNYLPRVLDRQPDKNGLLHVTGQELEEFFARVHRLTPRQLEEIYGLTNNEADLVLPAINLYRQLLMAANTQNVIIITNRFIDGIVALYIARQKDPKFMEVMKGLQMSQLRGMARRFRCNLSHISLVAEFCRHIFDSLADSQGLDEKDWLHLEAAATLHGIGKFFSLRSDKIYNYELIRATDLLGFSEEEKKIIAAVSYVFSMESPEDMPQELYDRDLTVTPTIAKLAAILRLGDALDVSRLHKILHCRTAVKEDMFRVVVQSKEDLSLERWTFEKQSGFFEEVFGLRPMLEQEEA